MYLRRWACAWVRDVAQARGEGVEYPLFRFAGAVAMEVVELGFASGRTSGVLVGAGLNIIDTGNLFLSPSTHLNAMVPGPAAVEFLFIILLKNPCSLACSPSSADDAYSPWRLPRERFPENLPILRTTSPARLNLCLGMRESCTSQVIRSEQPSIIPNPPIHRSDFRITACGLALLISRFTSPVDSRRISVIVSDGWRVYARTSISVFCKSGRYDSVSETLLSKEVDEVFKSV